MNTSELALQERIKELTCLYEVSSIIVNANSKEMIDTIRAIAVCLKKGFYAPNTTEILIETPKDRYKTGSIASEKQICSEIIVFNKVQGKIVASLLEKEASFLKEEQPLLDNVALKLGNLLERIEIQNNERSLKRQMEHADRLGILGEITAGIAHELNTPLANILGFAELLKEETELSKHSAVDLDKIISNAIFSREVVKKLLFFACEMPKELKELNVVPIVKESVALLDATFKKAEVRYTLHLEEELLMLRADKVQITQVVFNLVMNAIYFSPKKSTVHIDVFQSNKHLVLKVADEGIGLSEEALEKVFQPFFSTKPTGDGAGLGLSVVHGIVAGHKGTIVAENRKNKGAVFTVKLPKLD
ncbi:sensor histidine kinase [Flavicella sediminum]|uniref:sensor histidine kinase n=1 Tax=Flavicella sediminum TaxID=2585141 RepID=UPI0011200F63|nr:HAMP domain-containing sensor histidine kinase [Flavicella sediminum]